MNSGSPLRGRLLDLAPTRDRLVIQTATGAREIKLGNGHKLSDLVNTGDLIEVSSDWTQTSLLTQNLAPRRSTDFMNRVLNPRRERGVATRERCEAVVHQYFSAEGFRHTRTPLLVPCPGMEPHIRVFKTATGAYLPTSPEFAMKRLLAGGLEKIYQLNSCFRLEPRSTTHLPEFMMIEWYRAYEKLETIQSDVERLVESLAVDTYGKPQIEFQGQTLSVKTPWPRFTPRGLFQKHFNVDLAHVTRDELAEVCVREKLQALEDATWDDLYFVLWLNRIEPALPKDSAVFVQDYPPSQAALAQLATHADGTQWARRFEFYIAGLELGNAFEELTDPKEQRRTFCSGHGSQGTDLRQ